MISNLKLIGTFHGRGRHWHINSVVEIKELRKMAEEKLGSRFDVKEFHDNVLKTVHLSAVREKINEWVASKLK
jgi:hypothetical protein